MPKISGRILAILISLILLTVLTAAQSPQKIKRTTFKTGTVEAGVGMTVSIVGAPAGAIRVEGWSRNEVEISAEIEIEAENEADLAELAKVTGFVVEDGLTNINVVTVGPHDKKYLKKAAKGFPKRLRFTPFRLAYTIRVPHYTDLVIDGGKGDLVLTGVEGSMRIDLLESNAVFNISGGSIQATIGSGNVTVNVLKPSWRGRFAEIQVAAGTLDLRMPPDMNANLSARVLRAGSIQNSFKNIKPVRKTTFSETAMDGIAGNGGARLSFTVGDGILSIDTSGNLKIAEN